MKKLFITAVLAAMPFIASAQTTAFDQFENVEGIDYLNVEKDMFKMLSSVESSIGDEKTEKYADLIEDIDKLRVFTTKEKKHRKALANAVSDYVKQDKLEELMSFNGKDAKVKIYVNKGGDASLIKEGLVFVEDMDDKGVVVVSFTGNLNLNDLEKIKDKK
jgi:hypothetical protein